MKFKPIHPHLMKIQEIDVTNLQKLLSELKCAKVINLATHRKFKKALDRYKKFYYNELTTKR